MFLCAVTAPSLFAQAVSEWRSPSGVPIVIVEVAGGDVEHFAVFSPPGSLPAAIAGFAVAATPVRGGVVLALTVPGVLAVQASGALAAALGGSGAAAVVALGPVPARELQALPAALQPVALRPPPRVACALADGGIEVVRGSPERVELRLAVPGPDDARSQLLPAWASWLQQRLQDSTAATEVSLAVEDGCSRLVIRAAADQEHPREVLRRLRDALARLATVAPSADETARLEAALRRRLAAAIADGAATARALAVRVAYGGRPGDALVVPWIEPAALGRLDAELLAGHPGFATLVELERRPAAPEQQTLDNGALLSWRWVPGETGVAAVAFSGIEPDAAKTLLAAAATRASAHGWVATLTEFAGVPALAVTTPQAELVSAEEALADALSGVPAAAPQAGGLAADVSRALGLRHVPSAETVSVALSLPPQSEVGAEAAVKFFSPLGAGGVRSAPASLGPGLNWTPGEGRPEIAALADLPVSVAGLVAGQLLADRLSVEAAVQTRWLALPGRLLLEVEANGEAHVPALDARLAELWRGARRQAKADEVALAARELDGRFFGDAALATARLAAAPFLAVLPSEPELLAVEASAVNGALAGLPAWDALARLARGPAPALASPPPRRGGVRKSPPRRP